MDDISLYIDYIIVSSFCTPVSSFSLPLQQTLFWWTLIRKYQKRANLTTDKQD